jgi:L-lactate dehydrogenase complex protein LldG
VVEAPMSTARDTILGRIRDAVGSDREPIDDGYRAIMREFRQHSQLTTAELLDLFASRIAHYGGQVVRCARAGLPEAIAGTIAARGTTQMHVPPGIDRTWLPSQTEFVPDDNTSKAELDRSGGVLTGCTVAIALTGTIVLTHGPAEGRRALTLLPDYHLVVVFDDQIVETVPEALRRLGEKSADLMTMISGPSATADIEMTRIKGVHGPRDLDVILVARES